MKHNSLVIYLTLLFLLSTSMVIADVVITAELSESLYYPDETLIISGNLTEIEFPVTLQINILNKTDDLVFFSFPVTTVTDADDNFTATYELEWVIPGEYIINVTYGDNYIELEFEVLPKIAGDSVNEDLIFAIERSEIYLARIRSMLEEFETTYYDNPSIYEKLQEIDAILDIAEEYLENAINAFEEGNWRLAAKYHAAARNLIGRTNGILNSIIKVHKVLKTEKFMEQFQRRLNSTQDKVNQLSNQLGASNAERLKNSLGNAYGQFKNLVGTVTTNNVDNIIKGLRKAIGQINEDIDAIDNEELVTKIKNLNRYQANINSLNNTQAQLQRKGTNTDTLKEQLENAESLLNQLKINENNDDIGIEDALETAKETAKELKSQTNNGNKNSNKSNTGNNSLSTTQTRTSN